MLNCFERSRAKGDVAEKCDLTCSVERLQLNTFRNCSMNLKGIGLWTLWSVRKEHFGIFTCVFARECQSHVCEKSWDKIYVCCHVDFFPE